MSTPCASSGANAEPVTGNDTQQDWASPTVRATAPARDPKEALELFSAQASKPTSTPPSSSGWGFASWGASLVSTVSSAAEKIGTTVSGTASTYIDGVYSTLDPDYKKEPQHALASEKTAPDFIASTNSDSESPSKSQETSPMQPHHQKPKILKAAGDTAETVMHTLDKTFDFASDWIGNAVVSGYNAISTEASKLTKTIETYRTGPAPDANPPALQQTHEITGNLATQGVDALEKFGKRAMGIITPTIKRNDPLSTPQDNTSPPRSPQALSPTFNSIFENQGGSGHLSALEMLAGESQLKLTVSPFYSDAKFSTISSTIDACLDLETLLDELEKCPDLDWEKIKSTMTGCLQKLGMHASLAEIQISELEETLKKINQDDASKEHLPSKMYGKGLEEIAKVTTNLCEQSLRLSEVYLLAITDLGSNANPVDMHAITHSVRLLIEKQYQVLQFIHNLYAPTVENDLHLRNEWNESASTSMGIVHDAISSLLSVLKLYAIKVIERESNNVTVAKPTAD